MAGFDAQSWATIFFDCHNIKSDGIEFIMWPDGECYFDQYNIVIKIFSTIKDELVHILKQESKSNG